MSSFHFKKDIKGMKCDALNLNHSYRYLNSVLFKDKEIKISEISKKGENDLKES